jgi:nucleoside-diphosphate-sugar epimerase
MYIDDLISILLNFIFDTEIDKNIIYHVGSSKETSIQDLAQLILKCLEINGVVIPMDNLEGSVHRRIPDTTLLKERMDFVETELIDGLNSYIDWYKSITKSSSRF